jgi:hypothetical protein
MIHDQLLEALHLGESQDIEDFLPAGFQFNQPTNFASRDSHTPLFYCFLFINL